MVGQQEDGRQTQLRLVHDPKIGQAVIDHPELVKVVEKSPAVVIMGSSLGVDVGEKSIAMLRRRHFP